MRWFSLICRDTVTLEAFSYAFDIGFIIAKCKVFRMSGVLFLGVISLILSCQCRIVIRFLRLDLRLRSTVPNVLERSKGTITV